MAPQRSGPRQLAIDLYLVLRLSTLGFTWLLPLVGSAAARPGFRASEAAWLMAIALAFHAFAYMLNDVVDLWVDRTEPLRADSPLVDGRLSRRTALAIALAMPPLAFALAWAAGAGAAPMLALALAFAAMTTYDLWGKRCAWPPLTDAVQAAGWVALLAMGALFASGGPVMSASATLEMPSAESVSGTAGADPAAAVAWLGGYVVACVLLVNGVHGALRDLANDARRGARTTATWFGARARPDGSAEPSPALVSYAVALQASLIASAAGAWHHLAPAAPSAARAASAVSVAATLALACSALVLAFRRRTARRTLVASGAFSIVATLLVLPVLVALRLTALGNAVLWLAFGLPAAAMWAYNRRHWRIPPPERLADPAPAPDCAPRTPGKALP